MEIVEGSGGVFTLSIDGRSVFERRRLGRFPSEDEAIALVRRWEESVAGGGVPEGL